MPDPSEKIIADPAVTPLRAHLPLWLALLALGWGLVAALVYWHQGLTLSHYDAKGHLVVARRVLDSLTPGWLQLGAVWLPLPHVLNLLPVQVDAWYRTGASGIAISILSLALLAYCSARLILHVTESRVAAVTAVLVILTNPNLLYLQSTPMTEPLLLGLISLALLWIVEALDQDSRGPWLRASGALALALLTRYEAWPVAGAALAATVVARWHAGAGLRRGIVDAAWLASIPAAALLWFVVHSKVTVGAWFVTLRAPGNRRHRRGVVGLARPRVRGAGAHRGGCRRPSGVLVVATAPASKRTGRSGLAWCGRAALVRVLPGTSFPHPLHGAAGGGQRSAAGPGSGPVAPLAGGSGSLAVDRCLVEHAAV